MWKLALLVTSAFALKVQNDAAAKLSCLDYSTPGERNLPPMNTASIPTNLNAAVGCMDEQNSKARELLRTFIGTQEGSSTSETNTALEWWSHVGFELFQELRDEELMKDEIRSTPWVLNEIELEASKGLMEAENDYVTALNTAGESTWGISVETSDLDLYNYRKKGLVLPPIPGWEIRFPPVMISSIKQSVARIAHELEIRSKLKGLESFCQCPDGASGAGPWGAGDEETLNACVCYYDNTYDVSCTLTLGSSTTPNMDATAATDWTDGFGCSCQRIQNTNERIEYSAADGADMCEFGDAADDFFKVKFLGAR